MSRNLADRYCDVCRAGPEHIILEEDARLITPAEFGPYADQYEGQLWVANAHCKRCNAKYLAWVKQVSKPNSPYRSFDRVASVEERFIDLSYRYSFNDEPSPGDLPSREVLGRVQRMQAAERAKDVIEKAKGLLDELVDTVKHAHQPHVLESYRNNFINPKFKSPSVSVVIRTPNLGERGWWVVKTDPLEALREVMRESEELGFPVVTRSSTKPNEHGLIVDEEGMTLITVVVE